MIRLEIGWENVPIDSVLRSLYAFINSIHISRYIETAVNRLWEDL